MCAGWLAGVCVAHSHLQEGWTTHAVRINEDNVAYFVLPSFYTHVEHISAGTFGMVVSLLS